MSEEFYDPIVAEVRYNREQLLAEFNGDVKKLDAYLDSKRSEREAAGFHYDTEAEAQARLAWNRQQQQEFARRVANL
ncbi:MAG: hypothetical protein FWF37_04540 [Chloroflexi bacterium]|nr:hypothetical protein [Chloroflexota bacterium]